MTSLNRSILRVEKDPQDIKNLGRTAFLEAGSHGNRRFYIRFRVTYTPRRWMPPHNHTFKIDVSYNRWAVVEVHLGGPKYL